MDDPKSEVNHADDELSDEDLDLVLGGVSGPELIRQSADHIAHLLKRREQDGEQK